MHHPANSITELCHGWEQNNACGGAFRCTILQRFIHKCNVDQILLHCLRNFVKTVLFHCRFGNGLFSSISRYLSLYNKKLMTMAPLPRSTQSKYIAYSKQDNCGIASLKENGNTCTSDAGKANTINQQNQSVFSPKSHATLKALAQKTLQDLHDSGINQHCQRST